MLIAVVVALAVPGRRLLVLVTGVSAAAVGGLTLAPARGRTTLTLTPQPLEAVQAALRPTVADLWAWSVADGPANVALFVPFACCLALRLRSPVRAVLTGVVMSAGIEAYQAARGTRIGTFADIGANGLGALVGAALAAFVMVVIDVCAHRSPAGPPSRPDPWIAGSDRYAGR